MSLVLILFLAGVMYLSTLIPQRIDTSPQQLEVWRFGHNGLLWLIDAVNLHSIYSQPWFAGAILIAALSLGISSVKQVGVARKKLISTAAATTDEVAAGVSGESLLTVARTHRYRRISTSPDGQLKFVRNPWGYFGSSLLHIGITVVISVSLYVALTSRQASLILVEGEQHNSSQPWVQSEHGLFARPLQVPGTIRLDRVRVQFDGKQQPVEVLSDISITDPSGQVESMTASINRIMSYHGMRIYHASQYGNAFAVTFTDQNGTTHRETIAAHHPLSASEAGYSDEFAVDWSVNLLSAKYFADVSRQSMTGSNPELTLRASQGGREVARTTLISGTSGTLGDYRVQLNGVSKWAKLIIVDTHGMPLVFTGFAIIMIGGLLLYLMPPRELIAVREKHNCYTVFWKAASFRDFFVEERDGLTTEFERVTAV